MSRGTAIYNDILSSRYVGCGNSDLQLELKGLDMSSVYGNRTLCDVHNQ